jgi:hypothetical protein
MKQIGNGSGIFSGASASIRKLLFTALLLPLPHHCFYATLTRGLWQGGSKKAVGRLPWPPAEHRVVGHGGWRALARLQGVHGYLDTLCFTPLTLTPESPPSGRRSCTSGSAKRRRTARHSRHSRPRWGQNRKDIGQGFRAATSPLCSTPCGRPSLAWLMVGQ